MQHRTALQMNGARFQTLLRSDLFDAACPTCGALVEKIQYLDGACYFCPRCQV